MTINIQEKDTVNQKSLGGIQLALGLSAMMEKAYNDKYITLLLSALSRYGVMARDKDNNTLLHTWAAKFPDSKLIKPELKAQLFDTLIANIDVNAQNIMGETPLIEALKEGKRHAMETVDGCLHPCTITRGNFSALLMDKMDVHGINLACKDGMTALHYAAQNGLSDEVVALVQKGANVMARSKGKTPSDMASDKLIAAYLKMAESIQPQKVATQMAARQMADRQNTMA